MFCTQCGATIEDSANFCSKCGVRTANGADIPPRRLYRSRTEKKISGVCGGLAEYFQTDANLMRLLVITVTVISGGLGAIAYIAAWILVPVEPFAGMIETAPNPAS